MVNFGLAPVKLSTVSYLGYKYILKIYKYPNYPSNVIWINETIASNLRKLASKITQKHGNRKQNVKEPLLRIAIVPKTSSKVKFP